MPKKTAFIGLGNIGAPMAATLLRTLKSLTVHDLDPARVQTLVAEGATAATSLTHLAQTSQTILLSLPTSQNVEAVLLGHAGIIHHAAPETLIIDLTSGNPAQSKDIAATRAR